MFIKSNLFSTGHPFSEQPRLSDVLEGHKRQVIAKIRAVTSLKDMTDAFLTKLVKEAVVAPLVIDLSFDKMTREFRNEEIETPSGHLISAKVARLSIPFTGEEALFKYCPETWGLTFPRGEVCGNKIQFDVIIPGDQSPDQVKEDIRKNCDEIRTAADSINLQARAFNESLPDAVEAAFAAKFEELEKQHAIFDDLGIKEQQELVDEPVPAMATASRPRKKVTRKTYVVQYVQNQFVAELNQINQNTGDVNNAIQSS
ncbi:MAG: hypothetical protein KF777_03985 [Planctomycetaceae bacterium]|nr:hypothetical protein [Planctomycetaceae bacterium]